MNQNKQPFWKDDVENTITLKPFSFCMSGWYAKLIVVFVQLAVLLFPAIIFSFFSPPLMYIWLIFVTLLYVNWFFHQRKKRETHQAVEKTQKDAYALIGTTNMGSAIHVAGHPLLQRDQPVVLALVDDQLEIFGYETSTPLDTICLKDIQSINTVVYDDERVPHIDVIDSAAQALQITFSWRDQLCTCQFRHLRKVRPIDWYHLLQQKRLQLSA
jgi:energy-coupling factor transporter transmembrane protein EcfT